ncbi:hypothetical protein ADK55_08410 [Streptomyces sp. WM4235]|nr:hypothetical protein ADK55_08410 [Streptomyces sp. WM4235]
MVVAAAFGNARHHQQDRLGPVQGLDLRLLVHAEEQSLLRRVQVEAEHVADLVDAQWIVDSLNVCERWAAGADLLRLCDGERVACCLVNDLAGIQRFLKRETHRFQSDVRCAGFPLLLVCRERQGQ